MTKREAASDTTWKNWRWRSVEDTFVEGAYFVQSGPSVDTSDKLYSTALVQYSGTFSPYMTAFAGALSCLTISAC